MLTTRKLEQSIARFAALPMVTLAKDLRWLVIGGRKSMVPNLATLEVIADSQHGLSSDPDGRIP